MFPAHGAQTATSSALACRRYTQSQQRLDRQQRQPRAGEPRPQADILKGEGQPTGRHQADPQVAHVDPEELGRQRHLSQAERICQRPQRDAQHQHGQRPYTGRAAPPPQQQRERH